MGPAHTRVKDVKEGHAGREASTCEQDTTGKRQWQGRAETSNGTYPGLLREGVEFLLRGSLEPAITDI